jgi:hypothetical protein
LTRTIWAAASNFVSRKKMGGGASKALLEVSSSQHDAAVAAIAGGNLEEALEICKKTR